MMENVIKQLRGVFIRDLSLPLSIVEDPYFTERIHLLENEFEAETKYNNLLETIEKDFNGNLQLFLEYRHSVKDNILNSILNCEEYKKVISDNKQTFIYEPICGSKELYTEEQNGNLFISYDMIKANFQALKYINPIIVNNCETWEDFVKQFTNNNHIISSKLIRQEILGKLNAKRLAAIEKKTSNDFAKYLMENLGDNFELFSIKTDEIIIKFNGNENDFENLTVIEENFDGFKFRGNKFKLHLKLFKRGASDKNIKVFEKEDYINAHKRILKCVPATYYPQVYKLLNGMEITPSDLKFRYEHELCSFDYPLELIST